MSTVIGPVRFSYCSIFEPRSIGTSDPKYSITMLIPKSDTQLVANIRAAMDVAKQAGLSKKFNGQMPVHPALPIHDGDGQRPNGEDFGDECRGHYVMTATTNDKYPPQVVAGQDRHPVTDQSEVYSGCYGYVSVNFAAYNFNGKKGIGCYLNNVFKTKDGEPLGETRSNAKDDFANIQVDTDDAFAEPEDDSFDAIFG